MSDSNEPVGSLGEGTEGQSGVRKAPWAPLAVGAQARAGAGGAAGSTAVQVESGAVLRSPAALTIQNLENAAGAWPWEVVSGSDTPVLAGPSIPTADLYRSESAEPVVAIPGVGGSVAGSSMTGGPYGGGPVPTENPLYARTAMMAAVGPDSAPGYYAAAHPPYPGWAQPGPQGAPVAAPGVSASGDPRANSGMKTGGVVLVDILSTAAAATFDLYWNLQLTWITGVVFLVACLFTAAKVRRSDLSIAVITPPLAFVVAVALAAQIEAFNGATGSLLLREARVILTALAFNAPFVFGGTGLALLVVSIRAMRDRG